MAISVPSHTVLSELLEPSYDPEVKRHHVVLYLPDLEADMELGECSALHFTLPPSLLIPSAVRLLRVL
jgi:hypothetical protein